MRLAKTTPSAYNATVGTTLTAKYDDNLGQGGGYLYATGGRFLNCGKGVVWNSKKRQPL